MVAWQNKSQDTKEPSKILREKTIKIVISYPFPYGKTIILVTVPNQKKML